MVSVSELIYVLAQNMTADTCCTYWLGLINQWGNLTVHLLVFAFALVKF